MLLKKSQHKRGAPYLRDGRVEGGVEYHIKAQQMEAPGASENLKQVRNNIFQLTPLTAKLVARLTLFPRERTRTQRAKFRRWRSPYF